MAWSKQRQLREQLAGHFLNPEVELAKSVAIITFIGSF
jgi:hypothetical protein